MLTQAMLTGIHAIVFSAAADADRAFFRDVLGLRSIDAGGGWPIFAVPPAELAVHPADPGGGQQVYLMCDDLAGALSELEAKGVQITMRPTDQSWGVVAAIALPSGAQLAIYQPRHPRP